MPIYEYRCQSCGSVFEALQKHSDPPVESCRSCSGRVEKLVSRTAFQLKGTGWYVTDYARKSSPAKPESGEPAADAAKPAGGAAEKPATGASAAESTAATPASSTAAATTTPSASGAGK